MRESGGGPARCEEGSLVAPLARDDRERQDGGRKGRRYTRRDSSPATTAKGRRSSSCNPTRDARGASLQGQGELDRGKMATAAAKAADSGPLLRRS